VRVFSVWGYQHVGGGVQCVGGGCSYVGGGYAEVGHDPLTREPIQTAHR
jgi:hypothetical protein